MGGHLEGRSPQQSRRELETPDASLGGSMDEETAVRPHGGMPAPRGSEDDPSARRRVPTGLGGADMYRELFYDVRNQAKLNFAS